MNSFPFAETYLILRGNMTASEGKATFCERCAGDGSNTVVADGAWLGRGGVESCHSSCLQGRAGTGLGPVHSEFVSSVPPKTGHVNPVCP